MLLPPRSQERCDDESDEASEGEGQDDAPVQPAGDRASKKLAGAAAPELPSPDCPDPQMEEGSNN